MQPEFIVIIAQRGHEAGQVGEGAQGMGERHCDGWWSRAVAKDNWGQWKVSLPGSGSSSRSQMHGPPVQKDLQAGSTQDRQG